MAHACETVYCDIVSVVDVIQLCQSPASLHRLELCLNLMEIAFYEDVFSLPMRDVLIINCTSLLVCTLVTQYYGSLLAWPTSATRCIDFAPFACPVSKNITERVLSRILTRCETVYIYICAFFLSLSWAGCVAASVFCGFLQHVRLSWTSVVSERKLSFLMSAVAFL